MPHDMKTVIVTGVHGFLGRHVALAAAKRGHRVVGIGHGRWTGDEARAWGVAHWHPVDVTRATLAQLEEKPDVIVHCAGSGSAGLAIERPGDDFARTVVTTADVLEFIRAYSPE